MTGRNSTGRMIWCGSAVSAVAMLVSLSLQPQERDAAVPRAESTEKSALSGPLSSAVKRWTQQAATPQWLGYSVPEVANSTMTCCGHDHTGRMDGNDRCGSYRMESPAGANNFAAGDRTELERPRNIQILFRAENARMVRIRVLAEGCALDSAGLRFVWLTGVKPAESVALLESFLRSGDPDSRDAQGINEAALTAIALHADGSADGALESFTAPGQRPWLRKQAAFWLGAARGAAGLGALQKMAQGETNPDVRAHLAFAFSVSSQPAAVNEIVRMAKDDPSALVRGQALFWLAQKAGQKAAGTITEALENDADMSVKKQAVFALSLLPKDEGVPRLIEVAQTNRQAAVRKQAMFWLGQSNDPRALEFFEKLLAQ